MDPSFAEYEINILGDLFHQPDPFQVVIVKGVLHKIDRNGHGPISLAQPMSRYNIAELMDHIGGKALFQAFLDKSVFLAAARSFNDQSFVRQLFDGNNDPSKRLFSL
ncbi:MAG: hypothetical protein E6Z15_26650 [Paenibacillus macerans]|nr:hypothetical protein [Paenibacillus macerans]